MLPRWSLGLVFGLVLLSGFLRAGSVRDGERQPSPPARKDVYGDPLPPGAVARFGSARLRVDRWVKSFAFWPDDRTLAALCDDGSVRLWDRATGRQLRRLQTTLSRVEKAVLLPGSKCIALIGDKEREIILWDTAAGKVLWKVRLAQAEENPRLIAAPDGKLLAVAVESSPSKVIVYEVASGRKLYTLDGADRVIDDFAFSPDSKWLLFPGRKGTPLWVRDVCSGKKARPLPDLIAHAIGALAFSRDGKWIAGSLARKVVVVNAVTGKKRIQFETPRAVYAGGLTFSADGKTLITAADYGELRFWDLETGKERLHRAMDLQAVPWLALSADGKVLALGDQHEENGVRLPIRLLDSATGKDLVPAEGHRESVHFLAFSVDGRTLLTSDYRTGISWDVATGKPGHFFEYGLAWNSCLSGDGKLLASPCAEGIRLWNPATGKNIRMLKYEGKDVIQDVAFSADGKSLVTTHNKNPPKTPQGKLKGQDGLHVWDLATGKETHCFPADISDLYQGLVVTPDGHTAIAGSVRGQGGTIWRFAKGAGQLYLWDLRTGRQVRRLEGHRGAITSLALSGDGRILASASCDKTFRLWEMVSGKTLFTLPGKENWSQQLALSPDGLLLATNNGPTDNSAVVCLWSVVTGKLLAKLPGDGYSFTALAFSRDGRRLASGQEIGTALVWDVNDLHHKAQVAVCRAGSEEPATLWTDLASTDAARARQALWDLTARGAEAVRLLKGQLKPRDAADAKRLQRLLADLDADTFAQREAASKELERLGERIEPALRAAQKGRLSAEARRRIGVVMTHLDRNGLSAEQLRELRAVEVLERVGSKEARAQLARLAEGSPDARLTQEAKAALKRLTNQSADSRP